METQCSRLPGLAIKGQGCLFLTLTFTAWLWIFVACQLNPDDSLSPSTLPSQTESEWVTFSTSTVQTSFTPEVTSSSQPSVANLLTTSQFSLGDLSTSESFRRDLSTSETLVRDVFIPESLAKDLSTTSVSFHGDLSTTSESFVRDLSTSQPFVRDFSATSELFVRELSPSTDSVTTDVNGVLLSSHTFSQSETLQSSSFITPSVSLYRTPAVAVGLGSSGSEAVGSSSIDNVVERWEGATPSVSDDPSISLAIESTAFIDSVAVSRRRDPTEGLSESGALVSHVPPSTQPEFSTGTSPPHQDSSGTFVLIAPTSSFDSLTSRSSTVVVLHTTVGEIEVTSSTSLREVSSSLPEVSSVTEMLDMNTTQTSTIFQPSAGETTTSLLSSSSEVSSPGPTGSNGSCTDKDTGCVEYQGEEDDEEEELRIKIIVGVACGAILLVVILGVFIGCVLRRRGKMSSGSKIDLSSYWDDSVTLSYINGHIDIPKDSADEMISLDNDSFLNSLDSMSFTNTWTSDTSKHTNF